MTEEEILAKFASKFPKIEKAKAAIKSYLTLQLPCAADLTAVVSWMKSELGFDYLDMINAVDWKGPLSLDGFVRDPNPNVFLPEGATPQIDAPTPTAGVAYREAFELTYCLTNFSAGRKIFLKFDVPRAKPEVPSLTGLYKAADWQEREIFDLLGVFFAGHPNLRKILTPEFIAGHPLRKDYVHVKDKYD